MKNIEAEIQARVDFKMNEILTAVANQCKINWGIAFQKGSQKHEHYWEAFKHLECMLIKESQLPLPFDEMAEHNRRAKRDKCVDKMMNRFFRGTKDYNSSLRAVVSIIEDAQNY